MVVEERVDRLEVALASLSAEVERSIVENRANIAEMKAGMARTDALLFAMNLQAEKDRQQADRDRQQADRDRQQAEKDRRDFNKRMAELSDSMGTLIEDVVWPNARRLVCEILGCEGIDRIARRVVIRHPVERGRHLEIDVLAVVGRRLVLIEAKRRADPGKVRELKEKIAQIPSFLPEYEGFAIVTALASVTVDSSLLTHLNRERIFAIGFGSETMEVLNLGAFEIPGE